jgi:phosphinothricin acetyltransferase
MVRFATPADAPALLAIYDQYMDTAVTFEYELPSQAEFENRIRTFSAHYPYLVYQQGDRILGYAYAHRHMERAAYQWNAELSIYLDRSVQSRGIGRGLYTLLLNLLQLQNVKNVYGCITLPNPKSTGLHESMGFSVVGIYHNAGYKCGRWHDVIWYEKAIAPFETDPEPLKSIQDVPPEDIQQTMKNAPGILLE